MRDSTKENIRRALRLAFDEGAITASEYDEARRAVAAEPSSGGTAAREMGGYALIEFLYARAIEAGEEPPKCAQEWREVEVAIGGCGPEDAEKLARLRARSHELWLQCREAARRWSQAEDLAPVWAETT